jgi:flagellar basal-body rod protein FlgF
MDRLIFTAMSALKQLDSMKMKNSNALANASTIGFKETFTFATQTAQVAGAGFDSRFVPMNRSNDELVIRSGPLITTGKKLDIYLRDKTVLGVQASDGNTAFTRRGDLTVDANGFLVTTNGNTVLGEGGGAIAVPAGVDLSVADDGTILATDPSLPEAPPAVVANLLLRDSEGTRLVRRADSLYEVMGSGGKGGDFESGPTPPSVQAGALEGSSINVAEKLVNFMDMSRSFEMRIKIISEMKELDDSGATMMRYA